MFGRRRRRYAALRRKWPDLFANPPDAPYTILFERSQVKAAEKAERHRLSSKSSKRVPRSWSRTGVVHEGPYLIVVRDAVRFPQEEPGAEEKLGTYIRTMPPNGSAGVAMLPIMGEKVVLLRHGRHATRSTHLEIPRGFAERGVNSAEQAENELKEEIDAKIDGRPISLGKFHSNTGMATDCADLFLVKISGFGGPQTSEGIIGIEVYEPFEVANLIRRCEITDSFTIAAFVRAWLANLLPGLPRP